MTKTDESIGFDKEGHKLYMTERFKHPQVLGGMLGHNFRIVKRSNGYCLQTDQYKSGNGEFTEHQWVDIPIVDENGKLIGYEMDLRP